MRLNEGEASPVQMARELGVPVGRLSHHVRVLAALGAIELVRTRPRRGATEHFYRATVPAWFSDEDWARVPESAKGTIIAQNVQRVLEAVAAAGVAGFAHPTSHLSTVALELDDAGMAVMADVLATALEAAMRLAGTASGPAARRTRVVLLHFEEAERTSVVDSRGKG